MDSPVVLKQTHGPLKVKDGESYVLRGTIHGDCKIEPGGRLDHRGFISGTLTVKAGATVRVRGMSTWTRWEKAEDIEFEGYGHPETGWKDLPFVGPSGFTRLDAAWQTCVAGLEDAVTLASLEPYIEERGKEAAFDAFWAATAVIARSGRTDTQLWALLSAAVFHPIEGVRVDDLDLWSPHDCKKKLEWPNLGKHLTTTPELFRRLLEVRNCAGRSRAFDYYRAISPVLRAVLALEPEPSPNAVAAVEKFRTMLRQQSTEASAHPKPPVTKPQTLPRSKTTGNTGAKRLVTADSGGEFFRPTTSSPIKAEIDPVDRRAPSARPAHWHGRSEEGCTPDRCICRDRKAAEARQPARDNEYATFRAHWESRNWENDGCSSSWRDLRRTRTAGKVNCA